MLPALGEVDSITLMLQDHLGSCTFSRGKMNSEVLPCKHCNSRVPRLQDLLGANQTGYQLCKQLSYQAKQSGPDPRLALSGPSSNICAFVKLKQYKLHKLVGINKASLTVCLWRNPFHTSSSVVYAPSPTMTQEFYHVCTPSVSNVSTMR